MEKLEKDDKILIAEPSFGSINELNAKTIFNDEVFYWLFAIENIGERERQKIELQEKARTLGVTKGFKTVLKEYEKRYLKEKKIIENKQKNMQVEDKNKTQFTNCPYPQLNCRQWIANDEGVYKLDYRYGQAIKIEASPIPIMPIERLINIETEIEKVKIAFFKDNKWKELIVNKNVIVNKNKILQLADRGIEVIDDNAKYLITYLSDVLNANKFEAKKGVSHLGWVDKEFIPYSNKYCIDVQYEFKQKINNIKQQGNYIEWKDYIKHLRSFSVMLRFMLASSFASVLIKLFNIDPILVHVWGKSKIGKTVATMICASVWGKPDKNFISNLSNTFIANERLCNFYKNMPVFLNELQIAKQKFSDFNQLVYALGEGKGKRYDQ